jgi:hypothetical protein
MENDKEVRVENNNGNGYVVLNGMKGIYTMEEVVELLHLHNLKVKISLATKEDEHLSRATESSSQVEKGVI